MAESMMMSCAQCGKLFEGSVSQKKHLKYDARPAYCSGQCRSRHFTEAMSKPLSGPCKTCGVMFKSHGSKIRQFCSLNCYIVSPQFIKMSMASCTPASVAKMRATRLENWKPTLNTCVQCGDEFRVKPGRKNKKTTCSKACYRLFFAKRFDRWIANPQEIALPQGFDEFLTQDLLPCLVTGCGWRGHQLSMHMNVIHGVPAQHFKKLAGFNLHSGIVSLSTHQNLSARAKVGVALNPSPFTGVFPIQFERYRSLESREHAVKARSMAGNGPQRLCLGCQVEFTQRTPFGKTLFHSIACRTKHYAGQAGVKHHILSCVVCGSAFKGSRAQQLRAEYGRPVCCTDRCKGSLNGSKPKPRRETMVVA